MSNCSTGTFRHERCGQLFISIHALCISSGIPEKIFSVSLQSELDTSQIVWVSSGVQFASTLDFLLYFRRVWTSWLVDPKLFTCN